MNEKKNRYNFNPSHFLISIITANLVLLVLIGAASAIYINPGESIQSAIDSLPTQGGTVELASGVHNIDKTIYITKKNVILKGSGKFNTTINVNVPTTAIVINLPVDPMASSRGPKQKMNTTIQDLKIHGYAKNSGKEGVGSGITGQEISNVIITNVWIENTYWGIALTGAKDYINYTNNIFGSELLIKNSTIRGNWIGIWAGFTDNGIIESSEISVSDNWNIALNAANTNWTIKNNLIHDSGNSGISLYSGSGNNLVQNNTIYSSGNEGIKLIGAYGSIIENNKIYNTLDAGIRINPVYSNDNIIIRHNLIFYNGLLAEGYGILGEYDNRERNDIIKIESNTIALNKLGGIYSPFQNTIFQTQNNIISDNNGYGLNGAKIISNNNDVWNNTLGNYKGMSPGSGDISSNPLFANLEMRDFHLKSQGGRLNGSGWIIDSETSPAIDAGDPTSDYSKEPEPNGGRINMGAYGNTPEASKSPGFFPSPTPTPTPTPTTSPTVTPTPSPTITPSPTPTATSSPAPTSSPTPTPTSIPPVSSYDNRLRESTPDTVLNDSLFIDIGQIAGTGRYRDMLWFDLSAYNTTDKVTQALLSLFWYYPPNTRNQSTTLEVYRPLPWDQSYVTWNNRNYGTLWTNKGGDWFDRNNAAQGNAPYASVIFNANTLPDNRYYDLDVTELVQGYVNGTYSNTGFFLKAKDENDNYIAFYSSDWVEISQRPRLVINLSNIVYSPEDVNQDSMINRTDLDIVWSSIDTNTYCNRCDLDMNGTVEIYDWVRVSSKI